MERKHAAIQQRVRPCSPGLPVEGPFSPLQVWTWEPATKTHSLSPGLPMLRLILILLGSADRGGSPHPSGSQHSERSLRGQDQPPQPTGARAGAGWRVLLGPLCSWPDGCHGAALGGDDCWWELLVPRRRLQGFTHWLSLSLLLLLPLPPSDAAAGEWAPTRGWGGGTGGWGLCPPRPISAPRTPPRPPRSDPEHLPGLAQHQRRLLSWDRVPFGSSCSCPFPPPLSQGSRWLGLLSHCRTHRTTLSVSQARVNGALSGWLEQPSWQHEWGTEDRGGGFLPDPTQSLLFVPGGGSWGVGPERSRPPAVVGGICPHGVWVRK